VFIWVQWRKSKRGVVMGVLVGLLIFFEGVLVQVAEDR